VPDQVYGIYGAVNTVLCSLCSGPLGTHLNAIALTRGQSTYDGIPCFWGQTHGAGQTWGLTGCPTNPEGVTFTDFVTGAGSDLNPQAVFLTTTQRPYRYYEARTTSYWVPAGYLPNPNGIPFTQLAAGQSNGNLKVIGLSSDGLPYLFYQNSNGTWSWGGALPNPLNLQFTAVAASTTNFHLVQVILLGADGLVYEIYQTGSGAWIWYGRLPTA